MEEWYSLSSRTHNSEASTPISCTQSKKVTEDHLKTLVHFKCVSKAFYKIYFFYCMFNKQQNKGENGGTHGPSATPESPAETFARLSTRQEYTEWFKLDSSSAPVCTVWSQRKITAHLPGSADTLSVQFICAIKCSVLHQPGSSRCLQRSLLGFKHWIHLVTRAQSLLNFQ